MGVNFAGTVTVTDLKKILWAFLYILFFMSAWGVALFIVIKLSEALGREDMLLWILLLGTAIIFLSFIPFFNFTLKKVFYYQGEGEPVSIDCLKNILKDINHLDAPVMAEEKGKKIVVTWRYVDAKCWEILAKAGLTKIYELHIKFSDHKKEVILVDVVKNVSWSLGPKKIKATGGFFRGVNFEISFGKQWGIKENFKIGQIYDYNFNPLEIKNPILNDILRHGWSVRFAMW